VPDTVSQCSFNTLPPDSVAEIQKKGTARAENGVLCARAPPQNSPFAPTRGTALLGKYRGKGTPQARSSSQTET